MEPKLVTISPFSVTGVRVRTVNSDEFNPSKAKLPSLWQQFFGEGVSGRVPNPVPNSPVFGVYSDYESDESGFYSVTAGVAISDLQPSEFVTVDVKGGEYLVFEAKGAMPQAAIEAWMRVWAFFKKNEGLNRSFTTDFEEYRGSDEVAIHIGVRG